VLRHDRTDLTEREFLSLFDKPRTYVMAYGTQEKVQRHNLEHFSSTVARMEMVTLGGQFRQVSSASTTELRVAWLEVVET
jgi:hypothetical protein